MVAGRGARRRVSCPACLVGDGEWGGGSQAARGRDLGDSVFLTDVTKFSIILQAFHAVFLT